jgi:hypothetical protein
LGNIYAYSNILGRKIVIAIPATAIVIHTKTAFHITPECKVSALAIIMHTKKEDRATTMIIKM